MSRPRTYPVGGLGQPADKPTPTQEQILNAMESGRWIAMTKPQIMVAVARMHGAQPEGQLSAEAAAWMRRTIDHAATTRRFEKMIGDGLIVGKYAAEWRRWGVKMHGQGVATYYVTARYFANLAVRESEAQEADLWERAATLASRGLIAEHRKEYERLLAEAYELLSKTEGEP